MKLNRISRIVLAAALLGSVQATNAQEKPKGLESARDFYGRPSYWRPHDKTGINQFETTKDADTIPFQGLRFRMGAGFTQQYQNLDHETKSTIPLYRMGPGFNLAMANLFTDVQLADGIRLDLTTYLSARHHNETWVKGGYIQFDKLPFNTPFFNKLMEYATIKIGHMEINYGDQHFRRSDGGNGIHNAFGENYILDAFSTEIGGEVYLQKNGLFGMLGVTNGTINSSIGRQAKDVEGDNTKNPAIYLKAGIDKTVGKARVRLSGSAYMNNKSQRNVLYAGDRTGSWYWGVMEPATTTTTTTSNVTFGGETGPLTTTTTAATSMTSNFTSGRFSPNFSRNVRAYMVNGFAKVGGLEFFGTYETAKGNAGNAADPTKRKVNQTAVEGIYRIGARENVYVAARYNTVNSELPGYTEKVNINRTSLAAGWFLTNNVLLKGEYMIQNYKDFKATDIRNGGKFNGYVIEAVVGF